jgi:glycerol-3-phosphate dehydrogenase
MDSGQQWNVFSYEDAQCEFPERLVAEWLREAESSGAVLGNYCEVLAVVRAGQKVTGVRVRDLSTGSEFRVQCSWVINATGPWADYVCTRSQISPDEPLIGGVRGSHILVPTFPGAPDAAVYTEAIDGRPIFVIPWAGQLLIGTTEVKDDSDPGCVLADAEEVDYLVRSFRRLFPSVPFHTSDIRASFAGVRPLPFVSDRSPASITRNHLLVDHKDDGAEGMISVIGGKLTTAASVARDVARAIGIEVPEPRGYSVRNLTAARERLLDFEGEVASRGTLPHATASAIVRWFGPASLEIAELAASDEDLRIPLTPESDHILAEAVFAVQREHATTLADILLRRVPVAFSPTWPADSASAASRIGRALNWDSQRIGHEVDSFSEEYARFLAKPASVEK